MTGIGTKLFFRVHEIFSEWSRPHDLADPRNIVAFEGRGKWLLGEKLHHISLEPQKS